MSEIAELLARVNAERSANNKTQSAFAEVVQRYQDLVFACAFAVLGDFQMAEDAAQAKTRS